MRSRAKTLAAVALLLCIELFAQQIVDNSGAARTLPFRTSVLEPGSCGVSELYWNLTTSVVRRCIAANVWADAILPEVNISTSGPVAVTLVGWHLNNTAGAITYNLPLITASNIGSQYCFRNATGKTGAITLQEPAPTYMDKAGANGAAAGTLVSGGALGDAVCVVAASTTQYFAYPTSGTWTNN